MLAIQLGNAGLWWTNVLALAGIYVLLAVSLNLINGHAGMFSLGHHGFWAIGAYGAAWITNQLARGDHGGATIYLSSCLFAMFFAAVGGLIVGLPCLRLRGDYLAVATLGFGEIVRIAIQNSDPETLGGSVGLAIPRVLMRVTPSTKGEFRLLTVGILSLLCLLVTWGIANFVRSAPGRRLLAVAQDETAAALLGIDPTRSKVLAFVLGSAVAGLAGAAYVHYQSFINPLEFTFMETVKVFLIVVLGGMGSLSGSVLAALLVTLVDRWLAGLPQGVEQWRQVLFPLLLAILILFRPQGLLGRREAWELLRPRRSGS
ncbi:MAG: branched-chain amino acid ABC transporter permease [Planctomycetota bacterium]